MRPAAAGVHLGPLGNDLHPSNAAVANVTQLVTLDRDVLTERAGRLSASSLELVLAGIDTLLGKGLTLG